MSEKRVTGPIQVFVIGFENFEATGQILAELRRVRKRGVIRVVDLLFVQKDAHGDISNSMHLTDLSEAERMRLGAVAGELIGLGAGSTEAAIEGAALGAIAVAERDFGLSRERLRELADSIPNNSAAAILVIEHHWASRLRNAIAGAGGQALAQAMISPTALLMVGQELNAIAEAEEAIEAAEAVKLAAAIDNAQTLAAPQLIEATAITEAAEVVAAALAVEEAAADEAIAALIAADLIEQQAIQEATDVVFAVMEVEDAAIEEAAEVVEAAEAVEEAAILEAVRVLVAARVIEEEAAREAIAALIAADIIEEEAAEEAIAAVLAESSDG